MIRDPTTENQIPRDFIRLLPKDMHPPIAHTMIPMIITADAALSSTKVDLSTTPCLNMAANLVVRSEKENPVVKSEIFLLIKSDIRPGLNPGKNIKKPAQSVNMRRAPYNTEDGLLDAFVALIILSMFCLSPSTIADVRSMSACKSF